MTMTLNDWIETRIGMMVSGSALMNHRESLIEIVKMRMIKDFLYVDSQVIDCDGLYKIDILRTDQMFQIYKMNWNDCEWHKYDIQMYDDVCAFIAGKMIAKCKRIKSGDDE